MTTDRPPIVGEMLGELLVMGLDDWNSMPWFDQMLKRMTDSWDPEARTTVGLGLVAMALYQDLMIPGDLADGLFHPWDLPKRDALDRIVREYLEIGVANLTFGDIAWMENTEKGNAIARRLVADGDAARDAGEG
jgi:hypothetical protein